MDIDAVAFVVVVCIVVAAIVYSISLAILNGGEVALEGHTGKRGFSVRAKGHRRRKRTLPKPKGKIGAP